MKTLNIVWNENQKPVSTHFGDIYFSNDNAVAESHYVFIDGNQLNERFITHTTSTFIVAETGFGSGLNFLILWNTFLQFRQQYPQHILNSLLFFSIEKYPLSVEEMVAVHQIIINDTQLSKLAQKLQNRWPCQYAQFDTISLFGSISLNVLFADVQQFASYLKERNVLIDAWFFDGFSPAKNSDMWSQKLFTDLYQVTRCQGTFATFTAAGQVRRNLINAGFHLNKRKGYGKKREMLVGHKPK